MIRSHRRPRAAARRAGIAAVSTALLAGGLAPLVAGGAEAASLLPGPTVVGPSEATSVLKEVVLDWAPTVGATSYVVQVGTDQEWSDAPTLALTTVATRLTLPASLPHASYMWRVAAVGAGGQGRWSTNGTFSRGWGDQAGPLTPAEGTAVGPDAGRPTFSWTPVPTASEYQLQVSTSRFFDAPFRTTATDKTEACFTTRTSVTPFTGQANAKNDGAGECVFTLLGTGEVRYWRVRPLDHVVDGAAEVDTSPIVDEGINSQPPQQEPDSLDTSACSIPRVAASASPSTSGSPSPSASPSAAPSPSGSASPSATPSASPSAAAGGPCEPANTTEKGPWSTTTSFSAAYAGAAPDESRRFERLAAVNSPALSSDVCAAAVCRDFPTVSWPAVPGASRYRLYVALDSRYDNIQAIVETSGLQWTPTDQWRESTAGAAYYVVVQPCTTTGSQAGCGAVGAPTTFRKSSPKLAPTAPAEDVALPGGEVVLSWQGASQALAASTGRPATSEAYAYHVQVSTPANPDFLTAGLVDDATVDSTHHVSATKTYGDGQFLWRVQAVDASGHKLPFSAVRAFSRDATPPTFTVTPATTSVNGPVKVSFSEPVVGVSASTVTLAGASASLAVSADRRTATLTPRTRLRPGALHGVSVTAAVTDPAGNPVVARTVGVRVNPVADDRSPSVLLAGTWARLGASNAVAGTYSRSVPTSRAWAVASVVMSGRGFDVKGCVGPTNGIVEVWVDGVRVQRFDAYRSFSGCGVTFARTTFVKGPGVHRVEVRGTGAKSARSKGTTFGIDAISAIV